MQAVDTWAQRFASKLSVYPKFTSCDKTPDEIKADVISVNATPIAMPIFAERRSMIHRKLSTLRKPPTRIW